MECGKLTAKLRDAVPVCFIENGKEVKRFKNIEIPDEIKQLPFVDFKFDVPASGAITFKIMFEEGVLPTEWPEPRQRKSRGTKLADIPQEAETAVQELVEGEAQPIDESDAKVTQEPEIEEPINRLVFNETGDQRKELVKSIGEYYGIAPVYQNAPTFAYRIGEIEVDRNGTVTGPIDQALIAWLASEGFTEN